MMYAKIGSPDSSPPNHIKDAVWITERNSKSPMRLQWADRAAATC